MLKKLSIIFVSLFLFYVELPAFDLKKQGKFSLVLNGIVVLGLIAFVIYYFLKKKNDGGDQE